MGGACSSMKPTSFPGSSEDTGNEVGRKRVALWDGEESFCVECSLHPRVYLVDNFGVEIEM